MSVVVYPRLAELLEEQQLTIVELERRIADRFGLSVDPEGLSRLADVAPIQQTDIALAGAAAAALGVGLDDLFTVAALPGQGDDQLEVLSGEDSRRLATLLDQEGPLDTDEQGELERLLARYGQLLRQRRALEIARKRGISVEQVGREMAERLAAALAWWDTFHRDPHRDQILAEAAADLRARWPA